VKRVRASVTVPGRAQEAEALWLDDARWASWVDGFGHVVVKDPDWPAPGTRLRWASPPRGRGLVEERVLERAPAERLVLGVEDERLTGTQEVRFEPEADEVTVFLTLEYSLKERTPPLVDRFFVRRALQDSLRRTVARFANERLAELS
jgi:Polyketide cyclase / dehydrase and lipid transport